MHARRSTKNRIAHERALERLRVACAAAITGRDPDSAHELRVASARLRVWLRLSSLRVLDDDLRWLRRQAAEVRTLDVWLRQRPPAQLAEGWREDRVAARRTLSKALTAPRVAALLQALAPLPAPSTAQAVRATAALAQRALDALEHPDTIEARHRLRRAVRSVRYALEWQGLEATPMVELQDALGDVCDRGFLLAATRGRRRELVRYRRALGGELRAATTRVRELTPAASRQLEELTR
jgi:CHAD domain-containing protein